jgi:hypothetical protein
MIHEAMVALVARLTAAGVPACLDKRDLNPPGVMVLPPVVHWTRLSGDCAEADWSLLVAVPDAGGGPALPGLSALVEQVRAALGGEVVTGAPTDIILSDGPPVPGYLLTFDTDI